MTRLRAQLRRPVTLLVLATSKPVARWARRVIEIGHPGFKLRPIVISFETIPRVTDPALALEKPELAVLSAIAHPGDDAVGQVALEAIRDLTGDRRALYWDVIAGAHAGVARQFLEDFMKGYEYQSEFAKKYFSQGREEGREEGRKEGRIEVILELARAKLSLLSAEDEQRIRSLHGPELKALGIALARANDETQARAILDQQNPAGS